MRRRGFFQVLCAAALLAGPADAGVEPLRMAVTDISGLEIQAEFGAFRDVLAKARH